MPKHRREETELDMITRHQRRSKKKRFFKPDRPDSFLVRFVRTAGSIIKLDKFVTWVPRLTPRKAIRGSSEGTMSSSPRPGPSRPRQPRSNSDRSASASGSSSTSSSPVPELGPEGRSKADAITVGDSDDSDDSDDGGDGENGTDDHTIRSNAQPIAGPSRLRRLDNGALPNGTSKYESSLSPVNHITKRERVGRRPNLEDSIRKPNYAFQRPPTPDELPSPSTPSRRPVPTPQRRKQRSSTPKSKKQTAAKLALFRDRIQYHANAFGGATQLERVTNILNRTLPAARIKETEFQKGASNLDNGEQNQLYRQMLNRVKMTNSIGKNIRTKLLPSRPRPPISSATYTHQRSADIEEILAQFRLDESEKEKLAQRELELLSPKVVIPSDLDADKLAIVQNALSNRAFKKIIGLGQVDHASLIRLRPNTWLNDEIINCYGNLLQQRADAQGKSVHVFSSFFWTKMQQGYNKMFARWTKKVDLFTKDLILFPVNINDMHWTAAGIDMVGKRVMYFDSLGTGLGGQAAVLFDLVCDYLQAEHLDKKKTPFDTSDFTLVIDSGAPQQSNGSDCGVFTCQTLESLARGIDLIGTAPNGGQWEFGPGDMPYIRQMMVWEIAKGQLMERW